MLNACAQTSVNSTEITIHLHILHHGIGRCPYNIGRILVIGKTSTTPTFGHSYQYLWINMLSIRWLYSSITYANPQSIFYARNGQFYSIWCPFAHRIGAIRIELWWCSEISADYILSGSSFEILPYINTETLNSQFGIGFELRCHSSYFNVLGHIIFQR